MKTAVHGFNYNNDNLVLRWLENVGPFYDRIYLVYPSVPWSYNPDAATNSDFVNRADPELIRNSRHYKKISVIQGQWDSDGDQRNHVVDLAVRDGYDYLIVQDLDEFYLPLEIEKNLNGIKKQPDYLLYKNPWSIFWKSLNYVIQFRETNLDHGPQCRFRAQNTIINFSTSFALNLNRGAKFTRSRAFICDNREVLLLDGHCCHLAWVYSDQDVLRKISTWTHHNSVKKNWFDLKWMGWTEQSRNLCYSNPREWLRAVPYKGELPKETHDFNPGTQYSTPHDFQFAIREKLFDVIAIKQSFKTEIAKNLKIKTKLKYHK